MTRICLHCGLMFVQNRGKKNQKFCSIGCGGKHRARRPLKRYCQGCSKAFIVPNSKRQINRKYCSAQCYRRFLARRRKKWPSKEQLERLFDEIPVAQIARMYGVYDGSVRHWATQYGLTLPDHRSRWFKEQLEKRNEKLRKHAVYARQVAGYAPWEKEREFFVNWARKLGLSDFGNREFDRCVREHGIRQASDIISSMLCKLQVEGYDD